MRTISTQAASKLVAPTFESSNLVFALAFVSMMVIMLILTAFVANAHVG